MLSRAHINIGLLSAFGIIKHKTSSNFQTLQYILLLVCSIACDEFRLGTIFSDGMVLQRTANREREHITEGRLEVSQIEQDLGGSDLSLI